jgi:hypothetical protein
MRSGKELQQNCKTVRVPLEIVCVFVREGSSSDWAPLSFAYNRKQCLGVQNESLYLTLGCKHIQIGCDQFL